MTENSLMTLGTEHRPGPVGACFCLSVHRINWDWLAQQAHQTTGEHREMTKDEVEEEWRRRWLKVFLFSLFPCLTSVLRSPTITRQQQSNQAWRQNMAGTLKRLCSGEPWL